MRREHQYLTKEQYFSLPTICRINPDLPCGELLYTGHFGQTVGELVEELIKDGRSLAQTDLSFQDLSGRDLRHGDFMGANCEGTDWSDSDIRGCDVDGAIFKNAILKRTIVGNLSFTWADVEGMDVEGVDFDDAQIDEEHFYKVKNLDPSWKMTNAHTQPDEEEALKYAQKSGIVDKHWSYSQTISNICNEAAWVI